MDIFLPLLIGLAVAVLLYITTGWWGFWVIFPWIGFSITTGMYVRSQVKGKKKILGRKISILMIMPCLLIFIPVINNENFQLEGVVLIVLVGLFGKGFIHYAIAKIFGPLIWGRGFCGWACWTAAILDWLPVKGKKRLVSPDLKHLRFITLLISILIPVYLVFVMNYDVWGDYISNKEMVWMFTGNAVYYVLGIPLAFLLNDKRAFCKILCPVSLVMIPSSKLSLINIKPTGNECIECGACNKICPMDIDVMSYVKDNRKISHSECILCSDCQAVCPVNAI
ncbi:MAG: 4Fe-4S dicluster domain-containing protein [Bacteroidales bacterium]|nr:4Fe-4S dicluster domain-containing protein [Bacteroidales bacterium]